MKRPRSLAAGLALAFSLALAAVAVGASATPDATPAVATVAAFPDSGSYKGIVSPSEKLVTRGLACNIIGPKLTCYDTELEALEAGRAETQEPMSVAATCSPPLSVYMDQGFQGGSLSFYSYPGWQDLPSSWRNQTSSWKSGCRAGRLSDYTGGGGNQIGLPAGSTASSMPSGWNDRADAIYRY